MYIMAGSGYGTRVYLQGAAPGKHLESVKMLTSEQCGNCGSPLEEKTPFSPFWSSDGRVRCGKCGEPYTVKGVGENAGETVR